MGDFNETFLYHYTNESAYRKILHAKILLKSSKDRDDTNYRYGPGVYLTSLKPDTGREKINTNNRDGVAHKPKYADKTDECYFKFNKRNLPGVKYVATNEDRDVWRFPDDIDLNKISFYHGYTDESEYETYQQNNSSTADAQMHLSEGNNRTYETSTTEGWTSDLYDYETQSLPRTNRFSESASGSRYHSERSFGHSRGNDVYGSSQLQQEPEKSGFGLIAGTVAVLGIGVAALGLFAASRPSRQANRNKSDNE